MPVYEYECAKCGEKFELRRSILAPNKDKAACPKCGTAGAKRVYSTFYSANSMGKSCSVTSTKHFG